MSYARFGWDDSDVYVIGTRMAGKESFECVACALNPIPPIENEGVDPPEHLSPLEKMRWHGPLFPVSTFLTSRAEMVAHLEKHRAQGDTVPQDCIDEIAADTTWGQP